MEDGVKKMKPQRASTGIIVCGIKMPEYCLHGEIQTKFSNTILKTNNHNGNKQQTLFRTPKTYFFSVYRKLMSGIGIHEVKCDAFLRSQNLATMSNRLEGLEKLNDDVEAFMKAETGFERLLRYLTMDPKTRTFPAEHKRFIVTGMQLTGLVAVVGFFWSIYKNNKVFKETHQLTYSQRKYDTGRIFTLLDQGTRTGCRLVWWCTRLFAPIMVVTLGLTIYFNNTNPINYSLGLGVSTALNRNIMSGNVGFFHAFVMGCTMGLVMGTGMYFHHRSRNQTQDILDRQTVALKLYHENIDKYSSETVHGE